MISPAPETRTKYQSFKVVEGREGSSHQQQESETTPRQLPFGILKGKLRMTEDFDDPLPEFEEYQ